MTYIRIQLGGASRRKRLSLASVLGLLAFLSMFGLGEEMENFHPGRFRGIVVGTSKLAAADRVFGRPVESSTGSAEGYEPLQQVVRTYALSQPMPGRLTVYADFKSRLVLGIVFEPDHAVSLGEIERAFDVRFTPHKYDFCTGGDGGAGPVYRSEKGHLTLYDDLSRGVQATVLDGGVPELSFLMTSPLAPCRHEKAK